MATFVVTVSQMVCRLSDVAGKLSCSFFMRAVVLESARNVSETFSNNCQIMQDYAAMQHLMRIAFGNLEALWMARRSPSGGKGRN